MQTDEQYYEKRIAERQLEAAKPRKADANTLASELYEIRKILMAERAEARTSRTRRRWMLTPMLLIMAAALGFLAIALPAIDLIGPSVFCIAIAFLASEL